MAKTSSSQKEPVSEPEKTSSYETSSSWNRLTRSTADRMIAGVCGGLAEYFSIDSTLVRLVFILLFFFGGSGFLIYLVLWIIIPSSAGSNARNSQENIRTNVTEIKDSAREFGKSLKGGNPDDSSRTIWGVLIIGLGLIFLLKNFGFFQGLDIGQFWPVLLILLGLAILQRK